MFATILTSLKVKESIVNQGFELFQIFKFFLMGCNWSRNRSRNRKTTFCIAYIISRKQ
jgi:hypothetical protein